MASKRTKLNSIRQDRLSEIMTHALALNLHSIEDYQAWCIEQGFSAGLNKTGVQFERESQHFKRVAATRKLEQHKREGNMPRLIQRIYTQEIQYEELNSEVLKVIGDGFKNIQNRKLLRDVLFQLDQGSRLLTDIDYVKGIISFVTHFRFWLRPIAQWQPRTRNAGRQFASLARHLFAKYEVPSFMDTVWHKGEGKAKGWFIHMGMGKNIRKAASLPIKMTGKMAHYFTQAPDHYDVNAAFRWAQVHALGGNRAISDAVAQTRMTRMFRDDEFWVSVLRFFVDNPMLDTRQYGPLVDYIWHQRYANRMVFVERGVAREEGPEQPGFSMHGRTPDTLLRQVENWHRCLGRESRGGNLNWVKSRFGDFRFLEGRANCRSMKIWTIRELLSSKELIAEGRAQSHCVATYARSCSSGGTSIWTMDLQETQQRRKMATIELHSPTKTIRQVRGLRNRVATNSEMEVIRRWADREGLRVASYL